MTPERCEMKPSFIQRLIGNRNLLKNHVGTRWVFVIGVIGQLVVALVPYPLSILSPQLPLLTPQDWAGSYIGTKLFLTDNWRMSTSDPYRPFLWEEKRGFFQSLYSEPDTVNTSIEQTIVWYADPAENIKEWNRLDANTYNGWPIIERNVNKDKPISILACLPDGLDYPHQCWYLTYWGHWFTGIFFWGQSNKDLLIKDIHQLTGRIDHA